MKVKELIQKTLLYACVYDTAVTFLILFLYWVIQSDLSRGIQPLPLVCILPFSLLFSTANTIYRHTRLHMAPRLALHFLLTVGGAWGFLYFPNRAAGSTVPQSFRILLVLVLLYILVMIPVLIVGARARRVVREESDYQEVYKKR